MNELWMVLIIIGGTFYVLIGRGFAKKHEGLAHWVISFSWLPIVLLTLLSFALLRMCEKVYWQTDD